jgi:hypothetical protein
MAPSYAHQSAVNERRKEIMETILREFSLIAGLHDNRYGSVSTAFRRDDEAYVRQVIVPGMRDALGYTDRPDIMVNVRVVIMMGGPCTCMDACLCAVHRKIHVEVYPKPRASIPANAHIGANVNIVIPN